MKKTSIAAKSTQKVSISEKLPIIASIDTFSFFRFLFFAFVQKGVHLTVGQARAV
jgi:hypothetical protein